MDFYKQLQKSPTAPVPTQQRISFPHYSWTVGQLKMQPDRSPQNVGCYKPTRLTTQTNEGFIIIIIIIIIITFTLENFQIKLLYCGDKIYLKVFFLINQLRSIYRGILILRRIKLH
jgi:hypothetical protein